MPVTVGQIDLWRNSPCEHQRLEFKEAKQQYDFKKLCQYGVALANEGGGLLLLGISDQPPREVVGSRACPNPVAQSQKLFEALGFRIDIEEVEHSDGRVVVFQVPSRPSGTAYHLDGAYLMRSGEALVPMSEDQLRRIFTEGKPDWVEEHSRSGMTDQDVVEVLDTQTFFELLKAPYPTSRDGVISRLMDERLLDRNDDGFAIRRLGALLLAKSLDDFPDLARKAPRVVVYGGTSKLETRIDQIGAKGYAIGFQGLIRFILGQLPQHEVIQDGLRKKVSMVPEIALRELIANALIHQDLNMNGASVMAEVYSNRIEISNPGEPIVPVARFIDGYQSRNERLAGIMRRMGICEEKSSGIDRVIQTAEMFQLPAPDFQVGHRRTIVIVDGPKSFDNMDRDDRIRACYQHCSLKRVMREAMTNQSLRERFDLPESKTAIVSQVIAASIEAGQVKIDLRVGTSRKFARYLPYWA